MDENLKDAAKRMAEEVTMHAIAGKYGKWAAFALADGRSDHVAYDSREDAVRHQGHNADWFAFILIPPDGMPATHAVEVLSFWRVARDAGLPAAVPMSMPLTRRDRVRQVHALRKR